ncbi:MAG: hypothetical protein HWN66_06165 [Candidatus Helarchaeota archaeon]|nr:hypothetical protein [Candidatus Helarchaeota archaeon]
MAGYLGELEVRLCLQVVRSLFYLDQGVDRVLKKDLENPIHENKTLCFIGCLIYLCKLLDFWGSVPFKFSFL